MTKQYYLITTIIMFIINTIVISTMVILQYILGFANEYIDYMYSDGNTYHSLNHNNIFLSYVSFVPITLAAISLVTLYEYKNYDKNNPA
ncbi:hypothetical protein QA540_09250 [Macrococcus psychrotolerans]|uniref:Uncharacterized protein n=1 Tax=Macrococcus psychrotolerans TaxID=3039389 RepID=A0AAU6RFJ5_9STAP